MIIHNDTVVEGEKANILLELESLLEGACNITVETTDGSARGKFMHSCSKVEMNEHYMEII